jgi:hypothetical protein
MDRGFPLISGYVLHNFCRVDEESFILWFTFGDAVSSIDMMSMPTRTRLMKFFTGSPAKAHKIAPTIKVQFCLMRLDGPGSLVCSDRLLAHLTFFHEMSPA